MSDPRIGRQGRKTRWGRRNQATPTRVARPWHGDERSDWDFGLYYDDHLDQADVEALGWPYVTQADLGTQGRLAEAGEWALNERRIVARAGLTPVADLVRAVGDDLTALTAGVRAALELPTWT